MEHFAILLSYTHLIMLPLSASLTFVTCFAFMSCDKSLLFWYKCALLFERIVPQHIQTQPTNSVFIHSF